MLPTLSQLSTVVLPLLIISKIMAANLSKRAKITQTTTISSVSSNCLTNSTACQFNRSCNVITGKCECPSVVPLFLSSEIPCLKSKRLGEMCMHTVECSPTQNSMCIASILFPIELSTMPNYRQWYIYNQISGSSELNFILHKVYGRCQCRTGYRVSKNRECSPLNRETPMTCEKIEDCHTQHLNNSTCNSKKGRCHCDNQFYYDPVEKRCRQVIIELGQFCVTSNDCQPTETNLECQNEHCQCPSGHTYRLGLGCKRNCDPKIQSYYLQNNTVSCHPRPSSLSLTTAHSLLLKLLPILLIKLFICNLIRFVCYASVRRGANDDEDEDDISLSGNSRSRTFRGQSDLLAQSGQTRSLLSLPPYETIINDDYYQLQLEERLPSYIEVMHVKDETVIEEVETIASTCGINDNKDVHRESSHSIV